jgi:hypothetical protein
MEQSGKIIDLVQSIPNSKSILKTLFDLQQTVRILFREKAPDRKKAAYTA